MGAEAEVKILSAEFKAHLLVQDKFNDRVTTAIENQVALAVEVKNVQKNSTETNIKLDGVTRDLNDVMKKQAVDKVSIESIDSIKKQFTVSIIGLFFVSIIWLSGQMYLQSKQMTQQELIIKVAEAMKN